MDRTLGEVKFGWRSRDITNMTGCLLIAHACIFKG